MPDIAPLDSAFMQHRCVHCGHPRSAHVATETSELSHKFEPIDLPRRDARVPVRREGRWM